MKSSSRPRQKSKLRNPLSVAFLIVTLTAGAPAEELNGQRVRQKVEFIPHQWNVSYGYYALMDATAPAAYLYATPPPPGPSYKYSYELVEKQSDPVGDRLATYFNNTHGYFGTSVGSSAASYNTIVPRVAPEEMARRRAEYAAFAKNPERYPQFVRAYRHLPPDITRRLLRNQEELFLQKLFQVLDDERNLDHERHTSDLYDFLTCLRTAPWSAERVMTRLVLHPGAEKPETTPMAFVSHDPDGKAAARPVDGPSAYVAYLKHARAELQQLQREREARCLTADLRGAFSGDAFKRWAQQEKRLWDFDRALQRKWASLDWRGYHKSAPYYSRRDPIFISLIERLSLEAELDTYLNRELARAVRAPEAFFPAEHRNATGYSLFLQREYPRLAYQLARVARAEALSHASEAMDRHIARIMDETRQRASHWRAQQTFFAEAAARGEQTGTIVPNPEEYVRVTLANKEQELVDWRARALTYLRAYPEQIQSYIDRFTPRDVPAAP